MSNHILRQLHEDIVIHGGLSRNPGAAKLSFSLQKPHFRILNPKIRKFDGDIGNECDSGGLGGERGGDCGCDLFLKGCGGLCVCHPKRNENCGLELAKAAATAENEEPKDYLICRQKWRNCGWSETRQQHSKQNKKENKDDNSRRNGETVAGVKLDNNTGGTTQSER
jgi:hypothetical protein